MSGSDTICNKMKSFLSAASAVFVVFTGLVSLTVTDASAQGNLLITPRRVVFEGSKKSMDLNLANTGADTATYSISLVQIRMKDDGSFETISEPDPGQRFAEPYIRFFPRSGTLGPNEVQVVKVQLTKANELTNGEYRSHFYFRAIPKAKPRGEEEKPADTTTISVKLIPIFGITIPVIIRMGEYDAQVTLSDISLNTTNDTVPRISLTLNRKGSMSTYGDLIVDHISTSGKETRLGNANGVAIYSPNALRRFSFNLKRIPGLDYKSGTLRVIYAAPSDVKPLRYAESEIRLN
jgi:P pilus assembly chaperone PapD